MVSVQLMGGLGNILFQISAVFGYAQKNNINYCIPKHTLNNSVWKPYHLDKINYCDVNDTISVQKVWKEISHVYNEIPKFNRSTVISGYFQSPLYFQDYRNEILELFGFDNLQTKHNWCSIHVRRGDYLLYPTKHPVVTPKYLILAIEKIFNLSGVTNYLIFSDDMDWCKDFFKNISAYDGTDKIENMNFFFSENNDEITDLKLMAECEHNIIANSTYSWWGAYLNNNPDKIVVTPDETNWFGWENKRLDVSTLLPKDWVRIKY